MIQEPYKYIGSHEILSHRLRRLSPREQLAILMRATQHLAKREKAEVLGSAGLHFLKSRFFPILLHFLFKRFVKDVLWSTMAVVLALICLLLLAFLEQVNARAVSPIVVAVVAFFLGFLAYEVVHLCRDVYQFLRKTTSKEERELLLRSINALKSVEKVAVLRTIGIELSRRGSGDTLFTSFLAGLAQLLVMGLLIGLILLLSSILPTATGIFLIAELIVVAVLASLSGLFVPQMVRNSLDPQRRAPNVPIHKENG
jgi:hypothetical protein